jgi:hypothetical protein
MLFDFAQLYTLGFQREDRLDYEGFRIAANALKRKTALGFLEWWKRQAERMGRSPLYRARNIVVHKGIPPTSVVIPITPPSSALSSNDVVVERIRAQLSLSKKGGLIAFRGR